MRAGPTIGWVAGLCAGFALGWVLKTPQERAGDAAPPGSTHAVPAPAPREGLPQSETLIAAASIPSTPPNHDVVQHLGTFRTGDERKIREIADRLQGRVERPWTVQRLAAAFAAALDSRQRAGLVYLLAASKDLTGLRVAGNSLNHEEVDTRVAAAMGIERYWIEVKREGGMEMVFAEAEAFWQGKRAQLQQDGR